MMSVALRRATACDLCESIYPAGGNPKKAKNQPSCVYACPHEAAFRVTGRQLRKMVLGELDPKTLL